MSESNGPAFDKEIRTQTTKVNLRVRLRTAYNLLGVKTALMLVFASFALLYAGDYASVRYRIPRNRDPLGTVEVQPYYAVPLKDGKTEFMFLKPENQICVRSLFPHLGHNPCWYVRRHRDKRINT